VARSLLGFFRSPSAGIGRPIAGAPGRLRVAHLGGVIVSAAAWLALAGASFARRSFRWFDRMGADRWRVFLELLAYARR